MRQLISFITKYTIWSNAIIISVLIFGLISAFTIKKSFFPEVEPNLVLVQVTYPGASPEEMEEGVSLKVEQAIKSIQGIEEVNSTASENLASISIEVVSGYDPETVLTDVKNAVDQINSFPVSIEKPKVFRQKPRGPVIDMILVGDVSLETLKRYADGVRDDLLASNIISQITITGFPDQEISIEIPEETLLRYGLTFDQLANAIRLNNRDISSGSIKAKDEEILIRSRAKKYDPEGIGNIIIRTNADGSILRLVDLAMPKFQFADVPNRTLYNGKPAVTLAISKFPEDDILEIRDYVMAYRDQFNEANQSLQIILDNDRSAYLLARLNILLDNGIIGLVLVLVFLGIFLNTRLSFWVAFGIPFSFLGMLIIAQLMGVTINIISLFGMILVVGILVDDGIVVAENIYAEYEKGKTPFKASLDGTLDVMPAVFTGVTTTILAFCSFFFFEGRFGQFIFDMAIVVILCLFLSLIECTFILPPHIAHSGALSQKEPNKFRKWFDKGFKYVRDNIYGRSLAFLMRYRYATIALAISLLMIMAGMIKGNYLKLTYFPSFSRSDNVDIGLVLKPGTRENVTLGNLEEIEAKVWELNSELSSNRSDGKELVVSTRIDLGSNSAAGEGGSHVGTLRVELLPEEIRNVNKFAVIQQFRKKVANVPEAEQLTVGEGRNWFGSPVSISLKSRNLKELEEAKNAVKLALSQRADLKDITDNNIPGKREINIQLKPKAYVLGLTHNDITNQIRQGFFGEEVQRLQIGQDEVRVWLRYPESDRQSIGELEKMKIKLENGNEYPLTDLIEYETSRGIVNVTHFNGSRENRVEAELSDPKTPVAPILADLSQNLIPPIRNQYPGVSISFEGQARQGDRFGSSFFSSALLLLFGIYILITLAFRSITQPLLVLAMIPLGILGAAIGHWIEGKPISILSMYGIVALSGVIVNDAIVFGDKFNRLLKEGHKVASAVFYAGKSRFRPIILTSLTTVVGLFPLIRDTSSTAQFLVPMAISVAYGILFGTFFILTVFPPLLVIYSDIRYLLAKAEGLPFYGRFYKPAREKLEPAVQEDLKLDKIL